MQINPGSRLRRNPGDITAAALLALGAMIERRGAETRTRHRRGLLAAIPVIGVNSVAFYGQLAFLRDHLAAPAAIQVLVALVLESVAIYLAWQAHLALLSGDSAFRLRLASYGFALIIAAMNYSHYAAPHWRPTFTAVAFGLCSAISPWLWAVYSRRVNRDELRRRNEIEPHAVRLGGTRWAIHPWRSWRVLFAATWLGVTRPADAIALIDPLTSAPQLPVPADRPAGPPGDTPVAKTPPPGPQSRREPRRAEPSSEARSGPGLAAASDREQEILKRLVAADGPLPSERELSREEFGLDRCQPAIRILRQARFLRGEVKVPVNGIAHANGINHG